MKIADTRLKKTILIVSGSIILAIVIVIIAISPIAKYVVEKYVAKYLGRQITMNWIYVNPFTGYVHISNLKIYESKNLPDSLKGDSIFLSAKGVSASIALRKLLSKTIEITEASLDQPTVVIIQSKKELNFSDLIRLFTPKKNPTTTRPSSPYHFTILNIKIVSGTFYYDERVTPVKYFIKEVNIESTGKRWNADTMAIKFSFLSGPGTGSAKGNFTMNFKTMDYRVAAVIEKYDLKFMEQYMKDLLNYGTFRANLDADIKSKGNFKDEEDVNTMGLVVLNDFHFGKNPVDDYASCDKIVLRIDELSPKNHQYRFDSLSLTHPFLKYERYDYLDNLQTMFGRNGSKVSTAYANADKFNLILKIADYVKVLAKNFFQSDYKINRLAIYKGDLKFNDYAISEKFSADVNPLFIIADSIDKNHKRVNVSLKSGIQPYGYVSVTLSINPKDKEDFDLNYHLIKLAASMFNPYLISYTSYPLDRGTIELNGSWNVRKGNIQSINHLVIIDPRTTKRVKNKNVKWLPVPLIMDFIRERGNVIDYEIPITGDLKNPKFHLHDVIMDVLTNIFVKPATTQYRLEVKNTEIEIEKSLTLKWAVRQSSLLPEQKKFVKAMVDFLVKTPDASISVYPLEYADKEKEHIQFFEAKKKYFLLINHKTTMTFSEDDSVTVEKMSVKDSTFVHYITKLTKNNLLFTIQEKCSNFTGPTLINTRYRQLNQERETAFRSLFKNRVADNRSKIYPVENKIPYNGFSFYRIVYKGELPKPLLKAYRKMNELNNEKPRKEFKKEHKPHN